MSALTMFAILLQIADASQTCNGLRLGAIEHNARIGASPSCAKVFAYKAAVLAPLAFPVSDRFRLAVQVGNIGAGSVGIGASVRLFWVKR